MRRGKQLTRVSLEDMALLDPINQRGEGKERALLMLHGFSSSPAVYRYLVPQLKHYDAIVCPVLTGHAQSIDAFSHSKASEWLATATTACAELMDTYQKVDVLGLSLGGLLACELSQKFPLNHLYLLAPALKLHLRLDSTIKLAKFLRYLGFRYLRNTGGSLMSDEYAEISYRKLPITTIIEMLNLTKNYQWVDPSCPVDLFLGAYDDVVDSKQVEQLFATLPNASIHWLNQSAHVLSLDNDLEKIVECINSK